MNADERAALRALLDAETVADAPVGSGAEALVQGEAVEWLRCGPAPAGWYLLGGDEDDWADAGDIAQLGGRLVDVAVPVGQLRSLLDTLDEAERRRPLFKRAVDELTDAEVDEAIWAASPYLSAPGVGLSATPQARDQARRLFDALAARMRQPATSPQTTDETATTPTGDR